MKTPLLFLTLLFASTIFAQKKKAAMPAMATPEQLMKMTPTQLEEYKQKMIKQSTAYAEQIVEENNLPLDKALIPMAEIKPPVKDVKRLMLLPSQPPTRAQIVSSLQQSAQQIQKGIPAPQVQQITNLTATQPIETIQPKAIMEFYAGDQKGAILTMLQMAAKQPDSLLLINNLGAMLNMSGVEHKAVPLLQYCLQKAPRSGLLLNNLAQSFYGLGDALRAADYFNRCLALDSLNAEANHGMGMLHYFKKEYDQAMRCFERELSVCVRRSTLAMAYKMGRKFNLRELAKRRDARNGRPQKDFLEEITLGKFSPPQLPKTTREAEQRRVPFETYLESVGKEALYWKTTSVATATAFSDDRNKEIGPYHDLVQAMLEELHEEFTPQYLDFWDNISEELTEKTQFYTTQLNAFKCPPTEAGMGIAAQEAMATKCCEENLRPLADKYLTELADIIEPEFKKSQLRWKWYINQLVAIVQLDPTPANQSVVYGAVSSYFTCLGRGTGLFRGGEITNFLVHCKNDFVPAALDSVIEADRKWKVACPPWLNFEMSTKYYAFKADCNKYAIEAGSAIVAGFEHEFKSGKSTLLVGPGAKLELKGVTLAEQKNQLFLSFDSYGNFSDFGYKSTTEVGFSGTPLPYDDLLKFGGSAAGLEFSTTMGINSGVKADVEKKGLLTLFDF